MDHQLYMFGWNNYVGSGDNINIYEPIKIMDNVLSVSCGADHNIIITRDHQLYIFGSNEYGELGLSDNKYIDKPTKIMDNVLLVSCGTHHTGVIKRKF